MRHVFLGWGSLLWDAGEHPIPLKSTENDVWSQDGPTLPLEFSRVSKRRCGALTLVIDPENGEECPTSYAASSRAVLDDAICDLRCREGTVLHRIGFVDRRTGSQRCNVYPQIADRIRAWAEAKGFDSVIWTDLPSNFEEKVGRPFSPGKAEAYLRSLPSEAARSKAKEYVHRAREDVITPLRRVLNDADWWEEYGAT